MPKKILFTFSILLSLFSLYAQNISNEKLIDLSLEYLSTDKKNLLSEKTDIKRIPNTDSFIIVLPIIENRYTDCDYCLDINNNILIWNPITKKIEYEYFKKNEWISDAYYLSTVLIDTAPYYISDGVRAFGIRYNFLGSSRVNPGGGKYLNLYFIENGKIREILSEFVTDGYSGENNGTCENSYHKVEKKLLIIDKNSTKKFRDIIVKTKFHEYRLDAECNKEITLKEFSKKEVLKYNNKSKKYELEKKQ